MKEEADIEKVKRLFYDESNGFGSKALKVAHEKFVNASAKLTALGSGANKALGEELAGFLELQMSDFADERGMQRFYKAAKDLGLLGERQIPMYLDVEPTHEMKEEFLDTFIRFSSALANDLAQRVEEKAEGIRSGAGRA